MSRGSLVPGELMEVSLAVPETPQAMETKQTLLLRTGTAVSYQATADACKPMVIYSILDRPT